jgi:PRC-barrel domain
MFFWVVSDSVWLWCSIVRQTGSAPQSGWVFASPRLDHPSIRVQLLAKDKAMTRSVILVASALAIGATISFPAFAQGTPQTVTLVEVNPITLATGYRVSKVVGSTVVNEANETVGKIDDLIVTTGDKIPYAILSVGGFLGMDKKHVVVPASSLEVKDKHMMLRGATKASLKSLPDYSYTY